MQPNMATAAELCAAKQAGQGLLNQCLHNQAGTGSTALESASYSAIATQPAGSHQARYEPKAVQQCVAVEDCSSE
jgi:hypothetical protein